MTMTRGKEEGWTEVRRGGRQHATREQFLKNPRPIWSNCFSFFVANLPDVCSTDDLRSAYGSCGSLMDAFVSRKKDRQGGTFGFIRFRKPADLQRLLWELNKVLLGDSKPSVSLPRYNRDGSVIEYSEVSNRSANGQVHHQAVANHPSEGVRVKQGLSYREAVSRIKPMVPIVKERDCVSTLTGASSNWKWKKVEGVLSRNGVSFKEALVPADNQIPVIKIIDERLSMDHLMLKIENIAFLGYMRDLEQLKNVKPNIKSLGKAGVTVQYLGGLRVMVSFGSNEDAVAFLNNKDLWGKWFFSLSWWKNQSFDYQRVAWLKISGIPPALWNATVCDSIAAKFGEVIEGSTADPIDGNMSYEIIGVLVKSGLDISEKCLVSVNNILFDVWVQEVSTIWLPDHFDIKQLAKDSDPEEEEKLDNERMLENDNSVCNLEKSIGSVLGDNEVMKGHHNDYFVGFENNEDHIEVVFEKSNREDKKNKGLENDGLENDGMTSFTTSPALADLEEDATNIPVDHGIMVVANTINGCAKKSIEGKKVRCGPKKEKMKRKIHRRSLFGTLLLRAFLRRNKKLVSVLKHSEKHG